MKVVSGVTVVVFCRIGIRGSGFLYLPFEYVYPSCVLFMCFLLSLFPREKARGKVENSVNKPTNRILTSFCWPLLASLSCYTTSKQLNFFSHLEGDIEISF